MHIGTTQRGARLHLAGIAADGVGFSDCGRRMREVWTVGERQVSVDGPWCGSCLNQAVRWAVSRAELDYSRAQRGLGLFRLRADETSPVGMDGAR